MSDLKVTFLPAVCCHMLARHVASPPSTLAAELQGGRVIWYLHHVVAGSVCCKNSNWAGFKPQGECESTTIAVPCLTLPRMNVGA